MSTTEIILLLLAFAQAVFIGIGGWVLIQVVAHGNDIATLKAMGGETARRLDDLRDELHEIKGMLSKALLHRRNGDA